jgi:hypothetical protein
MGVSVRAVEEALGADELANELAAAAKEFIAIANSFIE